MKYRTTVRIVCYGSDAEEAAHIAGEYLRGNELDPGVSIRCRTKRIKDNMFRKMTLFLAFLGLFASLILLNSI
ncbi:MAG: hypothetical protein GF408_04270 [Candidatus Omnitrophica bacterium]|nr:hypothetical protein [Candidatus Omnitrophota bacterium]